jgi:Rha family phage regulatory protein
MNELVVRSHTGEPVTNSLLVAEKFGKQHKDVLESIRNLTAENSAVLSMFSKSSYLNIQNKEQPMYIMNRDGFSLLVMGFTGRQALDFKISFIEAFNRLEEQAGMLRLNAEMIRGIVREELRGVAQKAPGVSRDAPAPSLVAGARGIGEPEVRVKDEKLTVKDDDEAKRFFGSLDCAADTKTMMYANACVLNAIRDRMIAGEGRVLRRRGSYGYWLRMIRLLDGAWAAGWHHNLPGNARRLCGRFYAYVDGGYRSLVHGNAGNSHARKY